MKVLHYVLCSWEAHMCLVGNHTFAAVKGPEDYAFLKACFAPVWEELDELISHPVVNVNTRQHTLNIVFGADYKVPYMHMYIYMCMCKFRFYMRSSWVLSLASTKPMQYMPAYGALWRRMRGTCMYMLYIHV